MHGKVNRIRLGTSACCSKKECLPGATSPQRIDQALKVRDCDVVSPKHCLTSLKIAVELQCHEGTFSATCLCLLFLECPNLFYQF